ncbi:hypothetical protein L2D14_02465 [Thalassospiraceae bacterium LMO-JJ14]|nr:hypothetical protein L2D14_02465 [Thalassospiraceae bacterium LMO-JJ14]
MSDKDVRINWKGGLIALLLGLVLLIGVSEAVVRVVYPTWNEFFAGRFLTVEHVPGFGDVAIGRKGFDGYFSQNNGDFRAHIAINDFGMRDAEPVGAADGRIWVIGDSMAFGWGVEGNEMYSAVIGKLRGEPAYNVASPGTNVCGYQALAGRMPKDVKPKAVVVGLILENDLIEYDCRAYAAKPQRVETTKSFNLKEVKMALMQHTALYNFFAVAMKRVDVIREILIKIGVVNKSQAYRNLLSGQDLQRVTASTAKELVRLRGMFEPEIPFVVLVAPARFEIASDDAEFKAIRLAMTDALAKQGLAFVDPIDAFKAAGFADTHFIHDGHWSANGHRIAAAAVTKWLDVNVP